MKKMKRFLLLALVVVSVFVLSGCNLIGHDDALDKAQVVASVNGENITKGEWLEYRDYMAQYYQQYYQQNYGINMPVQAETYNDSALEQLIQSKVIAAKMDELGITPISEDEQKDVESYADSMMDLYKMMIRYQNYANIETVEEEADRLAKANAEATPSEASAEATPSEASTEDSTPKATMTNDELDALLNNDLAAMGYTREYFIESRTASVENEKLHDHTSEGIEVTDDEVTKEYEDRLAQQKESYDATPTAYAAAVNNGSDVYYIPEGYRGVKNLLIKISSEDQSAISDLNSQITSAEKAVKDAQDQIKTLGEEKDTNAENSEAIQKQLDELAAAVEEQTAKLETAQKALEEQKTKAFDAILGKAEAALERVKGGEDFDSLIEELGEDDGMKTEPNKSRGYLVCEGMTQYEEEFQSAAMALASVGDVSDLVKTSYGYHILQYAQDVEAGTIELTDEQKEDIRSELLKTKQEAAYEAAVTQWVSEAKVSTFPKVMK